MPFAWVFLTNGGTRRVLVNMSRTAYVEAHNGGSRIVFSGGGEATMEWQAGEHDLYVSETPDQIARLVGGARDASDLA